jgi:hypothetical protein
MVDDAIRRDGENHKSDYNDTPGWVRIKGEGELWKTNLNDTARYCGIGYG